MNSGLSSKKMSYGANGPFKLKCYVNITYSPLAASLAAYFVYQMATSIHMDVSSKTLSASHL